MAEGRLQRDDARPLDIEPGQYYERATEARNPESKHEVQRGELVLIVGREGDHVDYVSLDRQLGWDIESFLEHYEYVPDGAERREAEILELSREVLRLQRRGAEMAGLIENPEAHFELTSEERLLIGEAEGGTAAGEAESGPVLVPDGSGEFVVEPPAAEAAGEAAEATSLVATRRERAELAVEAVKTRAALLRNRVGKFLKEVERKKDRLRSLRREQERALEAMSGLRKLMEDAEKTIEILNIYLGAGECAVRIMTGEPAPPEERIAVRQLVLYADEECALAAEDGGIDYHDIELFDEWLRDPENLHQVLPDIKGVVAMKVRRKDKEYTGNRRDDEELNSKNRTVHWLVRNGGNLWRITNGIKLGKNLVPLPDEFEKLFYSTVRDKATGELKQSPLKPGSYDYAKALEQWEDKRRFYGLALMFLQGCLDRTEIFHPLPCEGINLLDRAGHENFIRYVYDGQKLLGTGRPPFWKWQRSLNERLDVGHRIIGSFGMYSDGLERNRWGHCFRLHPPKAEFPDSLELHTIEERAGKSFIIRYKRDERIYRDRYTPDGPSKVRASCRLEAGDRFILAYDLVDEADIRYYMSSRTDREEYAKMFPLFRAVLKYKKKEAEQEEPFRRLLAAQIVKQYGVTPEEAEAAIPELVTYWKFKNRTHRALVSDDKKALRMIVSEFGVRQKREEERLKRKAVTDVVVGRVREAEPGVIFVGHKRENEYVALVPQLDYEQIFVREQEWRHNSHTGEVTLKETKDWRVVDTRHERWEALWTSDRWEAWPKTLRRERYLTGPERESVIKSVIGKGAAHAADWQRNRAEKENFCFWPLAVTLDPDHKLLLWYCDAKGSVPRGAAMRDLNAKIADPKMSRTIFSWKRDREGGVKVYRESDNYIGYQERRDDENQREMPWESENLRLRTGGWLTISGTEPKGLILWTDEAMIERFHKRLDALAEARRVWEEVSTVIHRVAGQVEAAMMAALEEAAYASYLRDEKGDPELWEDRRAELKIEEPEAKGFREALQRLIKRGVQIDGLTVAQVFEAADAAGITVPALEDRERALLPYDMRLSAEEIEEEEYAEDGQEDAAEDGGGDEAEGDDDDDDDDDGGEDDEELADYGDD